MSFLEECWKEREERVYRGLFEDLGPGIFPLSAQVFERLDAKGIDPRWLTHGVFKCPPTKQRNTWVYVTSGMSNPWEADEPEEFSGLGLELLMETQEEEIWALRALQTLTAYNLLLASGQVEDLPLLEEGSRVALALSAALRAVMLVPPVSYPTSFTLKSGRVDFLQVVGITADELSFAQQNSSEELAEKLVSVTGGLLTQQKRPSVV